MSKHDCKDIQDMPEIHVVIFPRDKWWIAQCLEYDLGAQAHRAEDVLYELQRSVIGHIAISAKHGQQPFVGLPPAPDSYWKMYQGTSIKIDYAEQPFRVPALGVIPRVEIRMAIVEEDLP